MADQVMAPVEKTGEEDVPATRSNLCRSKRLKRSTNHSAIFQRRASRLMRREERRQKEWPQKWETWRINAVASFMHRSGADAVEQLRANQDDLWGVNPQDASLNEDALEVYDREQSMRARRESENEAAVALLSLRYSHNPAVYTQDHTSNNHYTLQPFNLDNTPQSTKNLRSSVKQLASTADTSPVNKSAATPSGHSNLGGGLSISTTVFINANSAGAEVPDTLENPNEQSPILRRSKRKATMHAAITETPSTLKKPKLVHQTANEPSTAPAQATLPTAPLLPSHAPPAPPAPPVPLAILAPVAPPTAANLPLRAPPNAPGIPGDALALDEFFQKNTQCTLGVQLPVDRARTRWEWTPYVPRKTANAQFVWSNDQHIRDANRWRQQRIRRRMNEHGVVRDGRKHN